MATIFAVLFAGSIFATVWPPAAYRFENWQVTPVLVWLLLSCTLTTFVIALGLLAREWRSNSRATNFKRLGFLALFNLPGGILLVVDRYAGRVPKRVADLESWGWRADANEINEQ